MLHSVSSRSVERVVVSLVASLAVCLGALSSVAQVPKVQIKIATVAPEGTTWMRVMHEIDTQVRHDTGNAVGFKMYAGGVQGDEQVVLRKIRSGQLQGGGFTGLGLGSIAPAVRVLEVPFLFSDYAQVDRVHEKIDTKLEGLMHDAGYTVLGWADVGFVYLFSKQPLATQAQLKSAKMWLWEGDPLAQAFFKAAGVTPVPLAITDVMTSLQTRLVDGVYSTPLGCLALQWYTRVANYTDLPVTFAIGAVVVSNAAFDAIPAEHRDTVRKICHEKFRDLVQRARQEDTEALQQIEKSGVKRVAVAADERARLEAVGRTVWSDQAGKLYPQALLDEVVSCTQPAAASGTSH